MLGKGLAPSAPSIAPVTPTSWQQGLASARNNTWQLLYPYIKMS